MHELSAEKLERLLEETKEAHTAFEDSIGEKDKEWSRWWAEYIMNALDLEVEEEESNEDE